MRKKQVEEERAEQEDVGLSVDGIYPNEEVSIVKEGSRYLLTVMEGEYGYIGIYLSEIDAAAIAHYILA